MATKQIQRIKPFTTTETRRRWMVQYGTGAQSIGEQELVTTSDQLRLFRRNTYLGAVDHGSVDTVSALSSLYLLPSCTRGVWPDDTCWVTSQGCEYRCISGSDATAVWRAVGAGQGAAGTAMFAGITGQPGDNAALAAELAGKSSADHTHLRAGISDATIAGRALMGITPASTAKIVQVDADGGISLVDQSSGGSGSGAAVGATLYLHSTYH